MMNRRDFIKTGSAALGAISIPSVGLAAIVKPDQPKHKFPRYRGFNFTEKTGGSGPRKKFNEEELEIMADWGFDFARIPMSYWNWASKEDWYKIDEDVLKDIDEVIEWGKQYKIHINLNFHRVPGYCINGRDQEPMDLFKDTPENMQKALDAAVYHWKVFCKALQGNSKLRA